MKYQPLDSRRPTDRSPKLPDSLLPPVKFRPTPAENMARASARDTCFLEGKHRPKLRSLILPLRRGSSRNRVERTYLRSQRRLILRLLKHKRRPLVELVIKSRRQQPRLR